MVERWGADLTRNSFANGERVIRAKDRAAARKLMLVIDHYIPQPDQDAGSRSIVGIIDSLVDAGWLVKFWPHSRGYDETYTPLLEQRGIEVLDSRSPGDLTSWMRKYGEELDHVLVVRPDVAAYAIPCLLGNTDAVRSFTASICTSLAYVVRPSWTEVGMARSRRIEWSGSNATSGATSTSSSIRRKKRPP